MTVPEEAAGGPEEESSSDAGRGPGASSQSTGGVSPFPSAWPERFRWLLRTALGRDGDGGGLAGYLLRGAAGSAGLQVAAIGFAFVTSVVLARLLGPAGYGAFAFAIALLHLLSIPASLGMSKLLIRNVSAYASRSDPGLTAGLLKRADQLTLTAGIIAAGLAFVASLALADGADPLMIQAFWMMLPAVPLLVLTRTKQAALQGLKQIVRGQLPENLFLPGLFLLLVVTWWLLPGVELDPTTAVGLNVVATGVALYAAVRLLRRYVPTDVRSAEPEFKTRRWLRSALPLLFVTGLHVVNSRTDVIMLGAIDGAESVGLYNVAARGAAFVGFFLTASERAIGPTIASLYENDALDRLQALLTWVTRSVVVLSLPTALVFILFGDWILSFVYGPTFSAAHGALAILSGSHLAAVAMGTVYLLLIMTGRERLAAVGVGMSAVLNVVLNAALIPFFGIVGAAIATGASLVLWNAILAVIAIRRIGVNSTIIAGLS